ncbi:MULTISPECIES: hypothetical protein [Nocardiopsis]|uniref:Uncharacterized protein n=1 Tax=Nocardiopsis sinuspersici TaxID=501010 RepID=A0A1V3BWB1_9ACTN|nr:MULTISPECIES: hypothetical protein [Nocardiopsis]OOC52466.1 hypothetical protein NOSIN_00290 [Nocardiopsis sinuspersici]
MSTPAQVAEHAARNRRRLLIGGAAVVVVIAMLVGWIIGRGSSGDAEAPPEASPSASPNPLADPDSFIPDGGQELIGGQYPAGFPHTPEGAASAAVHEIRSMSTNDPEALAEIATIYYGNNVTIEAVEKDLLWNRAREIEMTKPSGAPFDVELFPAPGSYYFINPIGVGWEELEDGIIEVHVLSEDEIGDGMGLAFTRTYIHGRRMKWDPQVRGGDWVVEQVKDPIFEDFYVFDADEYDLDNPIWTPIAFPEWDEGE